MVELLVKRVVMKLLFLRVVFLPPQNRNKPVLIDVAV